MASQRPRDLDPHTAKTGVKITPPVLIEDHIMHFTPVLVQNPMVLF